MRCTVEYSVHGAMHAVYHLFGVGKDIPPIYHGFLDPKVGLKALSPRSGRQPHGWQNPHHAVLSRCEARGAVC